MTDNNTNGNKINTGTVSDQEHNSQIRCEVSECKYHEGIDVCQASMINVSPCTENCTTDSDTACATFEKKY